MNHPPSIVWVGFHQEGRLALPALVERGYPVRAILTLTDEAAAKRAGSFDFSQVGGCYNIPLHKIRHINDPDTLKLLNDLSPDVLCVIGWSQILSAEALNCAKTIVIGAHASLLPEGRGSAPINWAIINGLKRTGNTIIELVEGVDAGDILAQTEFVITDYDSCASLYEKVAHTNATMLVDVLGQISSGSLVPRPQSRTNGQLWPRRAPKDGLIDWNLTSKQVYDFVRALTRPYPGAFGLIDGRKAIVWRASWSCEECERPAGTVVAFRCSHVPELCAIVVACGSGQLTVHEVEIAGQPPLTGRELIDFFSRAGSFD